MVECIKTEDEMKKKQNENVTFISTNYLVL